VIVLTEAAKRGLRTLKPDGLRDREELRLKRAGTIPNSEREPLLYVSHKVGAAFDRCVVELVEIPEGAGFDIGPPEVGVGACS
jgi:hypothetical protein